MLSYRKFSDQLRAEIDAFASRKTEKASAEILGALATLGGVSVESRKIEDSPISSGSVAALEPIDVTVYFGCTVPASGVETKIAKPTYHPPKVPKAPKVDIWGEAEEERAAIVEEDGHIPRAWAEGFARLDPDQPPGDVPLHRWQRFIDDIGLFLDSPFRALAAALGWGPYDLFGCNRDRPFARIDQAGLLWLLNGRRLVALSEDAAVIEARDGVRTRYRRTPRARGQVLAWELVP